jgi:HEAT repeat protein
MRKFIISLLLASSVFAHAEEDMMRLMMEARQRLIDNLAAKNIPADIVRFAAKLTDNDNPTRDKAADALLEHADRKNVITAMIIAMKNDNNDKRPNAGTVLVKIGAEALDALTTALKDNELRPRATWALSEMGETAKPAVPALMNLLKSETPMAVGDAAVALGLLGQNARAALPLLIEALKNEDREVRAVVATAIRQVGPKAEDIPQLLPALKDPYMKVRSTLILMFGYMGDNGKAAIPAIIPHIKDENSWVRMHSAASLARFGADAKDAVPVLKEALSDEAGVVRGTAAMALAKIAPSSEFVPDMIRLLQDTNERVRNLAEEALVTIGKVAVEDLKGAAEVTADAQLKATLDEIVRKIKAK